MKKWLPMAIGSACVVLGAGASTLMNCADPRESDSVDVITTCDLASLSSDPGNAQSSVKAYVQAAQQLSTQATAAENLLRDGCNDVNTALGLPTGSDVASACQTIAQRVSKIRTAQPQPPPGPAPPDWFNLTAQPVCHTDPSAVATCINTCNPGTCDTSKCAPSNLSGKCAGTCTGLCVTPEADGGGPCLGDCQGTCKNFAPDGGPATNACLGECNGACVFPPAVGFCQGGCGLNFYGECDGTCTGLCNGQAINGGIPDAGVPAPEGGPPTGSDGNCTGICAGWCSSARYGACAQPCIGPTFKGGVCGNGAANGPCTNTCVTGGSGSGCAGQCDGVCTQSTGDAGTTCNGICVGKCDQAVTGGACSGGLSCGQNAECNDACMAMGNSAVTCTTPTTVEVEAVSDLALYNALKTAGGKIAEALQMIAQLRTAEGFVENRTVSDFAAIGATGDLVRACVAEGQTSVTAAQAALQAATNADPTRRK